MLIVITYLLLLLGVLMLPPNKKGHFLFLFLFFGSGNGDVQAKLKIAATCAASNPFAKSFATTDCCAFCPIWVTHCERSTGNIELLIAYASKNLNQPQEKYNQIQFHNHNYTH